MAEPKSFIADHVLAKHAASPLAGHVDSGEFGSTSEVIRDALRRAEERDAKREALDAALKEGLESGPPQTFDFDDFLREMRANYKAE